MNVRTRIGLRVDDATWARSRGWALSIALIQLPYYRDTNPVLTANKWCLLRHYWVATKLALSIGVIATGISLADRLVQESVTGPGGEAVSGAATTEIVLTPRRS